MQLKPLIVNSLLLAVTVAISVAAIEYGTRLLYPALVPSGHLRFVQGKGSTPVLGPRNTQFRQIKNTGDFDVSVNFNKYGFRDSKDLSDSTPQDYFLVGDSISFGWGVEETERYSNLVQTALKRNVYNLSVPGGFNQFEKVINFAIKNGAKVTNLLLASNLVLSLRDYEKNAAREQENKKQPSTGILGTFKSYLMTNSAFYFLVTSLVHKNETLKELAVDFGLIRPNLEGIAYMSYSRRKIESTARFTARLAEKFNTTIIFVPSRALWFGTNEEKKTADRIHREFIAFLRELGLNVVDIRSTFEGEGDPWKIFFANDGHWAPKGHELAARAIIRDLKRPH